MKNLVRMTFVFTFLIPLFSFAVLDEVADDCIDCKPTVPTQKLNVAKAQVAESLVNTPAEYPDLKNLNAKDQAEIHEWFSSEVTRGRYYELNQVTLRGKRMLPEHAENCFHLKIFHGTGGQIKSPLTLCESELEAVKVAMDQARSKGITKGVRSDMKKYGPCTDDTAKCEYTALLAGIQALETIVWKKHILPMTVERGQKLMALNVMGTPPQIGMDQTTTLDCVDQAANGTSYLIVLNEMGWMKHFSPTSAGLSNGFQPHYYTMLKSRESGVKYTFDLYNRSNQTAERLVANDGSGSIR